MRFVLLLAISFFASLALADPGLKLVVLDPGHGGTNSGAPYPKGPGHFEKEYTLSLARKVAAHLRAEGVKVVLTRTKDMDMSLKERINFANRIQADVFASLHYNATDFHGPSGHETFFLALEASDEAAHRLAAFENREHRAVQNAAEEPLPTDDVVSSILLDLTQTRAHGDAERLATLIQARLTERSKFKNRGVKQAPFYVLMGASMPAVVIEVGFINHDKEGPYITSEAGQKDLARGIADGLLDFGRLVLAPREVREAPPSQ